MNRVITTLEDAIRERGNYDKICLVQSWGKEFAFWNYDSLGLGNLITAYVGAMIIDSDIEVILFNDVRLAPWKGMIKNPLYWYSRSSFRLRSINNSLKRIILAPEVTNVSCINTRTRVLFLSTDLVNQDPLYLKKYSCINKSNLKNNLLTYYGVKITSDRSTNAAENKEKTLGVHIRQGDFTINDKRVDAYIPNQRLEIEVYIQSLKRLLKSKKFSYISVFSDERLNKTHETKIIEELKSHDSSLLINFKYSTNTIRTFNEMMTCDSLMIANSTFSLWAAILSGRECYFMLDQLPYRAEKFIDKLVNVNDA